MKRLANISWRDGDAIKSHGLTPATWRTLAQLAFGASMTTDGLFDANNVRVSTRSIRALAERGLLTAVSGTVGGGSFLANVPALTPLGWKTFEALHRLGIPHGMV